jgi:hypothetical protein
MSTPPRTIDVFAIILAAVLVGIGYTLSAQAPTPVSVTPPQPALSAESRLEILNAFMKVIAFSNDQQKRQRDLCMADRDCRQDELHVRSAVDEYNALIPKVIARDKLPSGTGFNVDANTGAVNMVLPPAPASTPAPTPTPIPVK